MSLPNLPINDSLPQVIRDNDAAQTNWRLDLIRKLTERYKQYVNTLNTLIAGLPSGGTTNQVLTKNSNTDYDTKWAAAGSGSGTVTSVDASVPVEFAISGNPITTAGTLAITKATQAANTFWGGPTSGSAAVPAFRKLTSADLSAGLPFYRTSAMNVPLVAGFAGTMGTLASSTDKSQRLQVTKAPLAGNIAALYIASIAAPYTVDVCANVQGLPAGSDDVLCGVGRSDGTKIQVVWCGSAGNSGGIPNTVACQKWATTGGAVTTNVNNNGAMTGALFYVRMVDDNTNINFYYSGNGWDYYLVFQEARATYMTATRFCICFYATNTTPGTNAGKFAVYDFTVTGSVLGDGA